VSLLRSYPPRSSRLPVAPGAALVATFALALLVLLATPAAAQRISGPRLELSARSLSFSRPGEARTLLVKNVGDAVLRIGKQQLLSETARSDFFVTPGGPQLVAAGHALTLTVTFRPTRPLGGPGQPRESFAALQLHTDDASLPRDAAPPHAAVAGVALRAGQEPPLLSLIVFFPLLGIPLLFLIPAGRQRLMRLCTLLVTAVPLVLAVQLWRDFDPSFTRESGNWGMQFVEQTPWIRAMNVEYFLGVDGLSITMVLLTALISVIAVLASWSIPLAANIRGYFALLLLLQVGMMGVFVALDFFLFFVFWELMLLPMYFLIGIWGGPRKEYAAIKFFLYTLAGSVLMLLAIIALYYASQPTTLSDGTPAQHTFNLIKLAHANDFAAESAILGMGFAKLVWVLLFIAFAIKVPIVPLHTWLPDAHVEAPTAISVLLAGVLLKMGPYALLRVNFAVLPEATRWAATAMAIIGVLGITYGALCAMAQRDLKRMVAYSSVTHMGFCLLGMAALSPVGISGAILQMFNHGTITSMLFLLVGVLYDRTHSRGLDDFGGVAKVMPRYAALFGLGFMASLGLPGLSGFIGEALVFLGSFPVFPALTITAALSLVLTAAYHLTAIGKVQLGPFNEGWRGVLAGRDVDLREALTLVPLAIIIVVLGFWPSPVLSTIASGVRDLVVTVAAAGSP
jgi:NADH-quinone oxidoreductase subunit M